VLVVCLKVGILSEQAKQKNMLFRYFLNHLFNKRRYISSNYCCLIFKKLILYKLCGRLIHRKDWQLLWLFALTRCICIHQWSHYLFFEIVKLYCPDQVIWQFSYRQHISVNIDMSDALHAIPCQDKNDDYDWLSRHRAYAL
jgi:hypothetical protein